MNRKEQISRELELLLLIWKEKEAHYINGRYDSNVAFALQSNAYKLITQILTNYTEVLMRDEVRVRILKINE